MSPRITLDFDTATDEDWITAYQTIRDPGVEIGPRVSAIYELLDERRAELTRNQVAALWRVLDSGRASMVNDQRDEWEKGPRKDAED